MRTHQTCARAAIGACVFALSSCGRLDGNDKAERLLRDGQTIQTAWTVVRQSHAQGRRSGLDDAWTELRKAMGSVSSPCAVLDYLDARVAYLVGREIDSKALTSEHSASMLAEGLQILRQVEGDASGTDVFRHVPRLAGLLPVSVWQQLADARGSRWTARIKPPRAEIPRIDRDKIMAVAPLLDAAGLPDFAWRAHAEAVYACYTPAWPRGEAAASWLSEPAAEQWLQVALYLFRAGKMELGHDFLLKAAVFGNEKTRDEVREVVAKWLAPDARRDRPPPVDANVRLEALVKVARLYAEMNAHPRALQLFDDFPELLGEQRELREEIEQGWLAVVKDVSRAAEKVTLYGSEVFPTGDPLKIRLPWAFSDEALRRIGASGE